MSEDVQLVTYIHWCTNDTLVLILRQITVSLPGSKSTGELSRINDFEPGLSLQCR